MALVRYLERGKVQQVEILGTEQEIRTNFAREGKVVLSVKKPPIFRMVKPVSPAEIVAVFTALGDLLGSGKNLSKGLLDIIPTMNKKSRMVTILLRIKDLVSQGRPLSQGMLEYKDVFGPTVIGMVVAAEGAGKLPETLETMAEHIREMAELKAEQRRKLVMPSIMFIFGIISLFINSKYVMPQLLQNQNNAGNAAVYLNIMKFLATVLPGVIIGMVAIPLLAFLLFKTNQVAVEKYLIRIPILRDFIFYRSYYVAFSSLSNLLSVKIPPVDALEIIASSAHYFTIRRQFQDAIKQLKAGKGYNGVAEALTSLDSVEKGMLQGAISVDRIQRTCKRISQRYYSLYLSTLQSLAPKIYAIVGILTIGPPVH